MSQELPKNRTAQMVEAAVDAISRAGGVRACRAALIELTGDEIDRTALYGWQRRGVSSSWTLPLEQVSGVSRHRLRPDLYPIGNQTRTSDATQSAAA